MNQDAPFPSAAFSTLAEAEAGHWWFRARNRLLVWVLAEKVSPFRDLLEVGCGTGYVLAGIHSAFPDATLHGAEYYEEGLAVARQRVPTASFRQLDATRMDDANRYAVIGAFDVLEHILADTVAVANLARALRPGGSLVVTVPQHAWLWSETDRQAHHVRRYARKEFLATLREAGLRIQYVTSFVTFLLPLMVLARRAPRSTNRDPMAEFRISGWQNRLLEATMHMEFSLIKTGARFPAGGSLLVVARKPPGAR